jgi:hypothetical protein
MARGKKHGFKVKGTSEHKGKKGKKHGRKRGHKK